MPHLNQRFIQTALLLTFALALGACSATPVAFDCKQKNVVLLLVGENSSAGSVAVQGQIFTRLEAALAANLTGQGYRIRQSRRLYAAFPEYFGREKIKHNDKDLLDLVRSMPGQPSDILLVLEVTASTQQQAFHHNVKASLNARVIDVKSAESLGNFSLDREQSTAVRLTCKGDCLKQAVVDNAKPLTQEAATVIAQMLLCPGRGRVRFDDDAGGLATAYTLIFEGFTVAELAQMEATLSSFSGYQSNRVIFSSARRSEYWYQTKMGSASLNRNLRKLLRAADLRAVVQFSGNTFNIKKITLRGAKSAPEPLDAWPLDAEPLDAEPLDAEPLDDSANW